MKEWKLIVIPILLVILAVGVAFAINAINWWWDDMHNYPGKRAPLEVEMQGVADWAKAEQGLDLLGEYTFVTTPEIDKEQIKELYAYQLSDGSVFGKFVYREEQERQKVDSHYVLCGAGVDYAKSLVEIEAQHLEKELHFSSSGFFAIGDDPTSLSSYYSRCLVGNYYRG
ncbi:MAG: hypothetical protein IJE94_02870 [Oscillospiraceae bacterium]|nr:hypothetical protein [Oscillospiraceae bacterium]